MNKEPQKGVAYEPMDDRWPKSANAYYLGTIDTDARVFAIVDGAEMLGTEMFDSIDGVSAVREPGDTNEDFLARLERGEKSAAAEERYELAAVALEARLLLESLKLK